MYQQIILDKPIDGVFNVPTSIKELRMKPQQVAQYMKAGRGFLITRNSATLADTDYEHVAKEIVEALNQCRAYKEACEALIHGDDLQAAIDLARKAMGKS
jgi:CHASE3 domain sensor protein